MTWNTYVPQIHHSYLDNKKILLWSYNKTETFDVLEDA